MRCSEYLLKQKLKLVAVMWLVKLTLDSMKLKSKFRFTLLVVHFGNKIVYSHCLHLDFVLKL